MADPTGSTHLVGVIGDPVRHSLSPVIHNAAFRALGVDAVSVAFPVPAGSAPQAVAAMRALGIDGLSVTMPHKEAVIDALDRCTDDATLLGAVNCIFRAGDELVGDNTDGGGLVDSLRFDEDVIVDGLRTVVLGAGGAARAVVRAFAAAGATEVVVVNRSADRAEAAARLAGTVGRVGTGADIAAADLVCNATPLGMGDDQRVPCEPTLLRSGQVVVDLIYHPAVTPLLEAAATVGAQPVGGIGMLVHQAARQLVHWTGHDAPVAEMTAAARAALARR